MSYTLLPWGWNFCINYLEFFYIGDLSILPNLFIYSIARYTGMDLWTCLELRLWSNTTLFSCCNYSSFGNRNLFFVGSHVPLTCSDYCGFLSFLTFLPSFFEHFLIFCLIDTSGLSSVFPAPVLDSAIYPGSLFLLES